MRWSNIPEIYTFEKWCSVGKRFQAKGSSVAHSPYDRDVYSQYIYD